MTAVLPPGIQAKNAGPAKVSKCCRAFFRVMAGNGSENETASDSLKFATWILAVASALTAAGILGSLAFAFSANNKITAIEVRQELFLSRVAATMEDNKELKIKQEKMQAQLDQVDRKASSIRDALRITGILRGL